MISLVCLWSASCIKVVARQYGFLTLRLVRLFVEQDSTVVMPSLRRADVHGRLFRQRIGQVIQERFRIFPTDTGIGDRDPIFQRFAGSPGLPARFQIAFQQQPQNVSLPFAILLHDGVSDRNLTRVVFVRISV